MKLVKDSLKLLKAVLPVPFKVVLKYDIKPYERLRGQAEAKPTAEGDVGIIRIELGMSPSESLEVLCHEYAHLLAWNYNGFCDDAIWGLHYSDCYRVVYGKH